MIKGVGAAPKERAFSHGLNSVPIIRLVPRHDPFRPRSQGVCDLACCEKLEDCLAVAWPIGGRFKSSQRGAGFYVTPIVGRMRSGIHFFRWAQHFVWEVGSLGGKDAWTCTRSGVIQVLTLGYRGNILHKLEVIQAGYYNPAGPTRDQIARAVEGRSGEGGGYGAANYDADVRGG